MRLWLLRFWGWLGRRVLARTGPGPVHRRGRPAPIITAPEAASRACSGRCSGHRCCCRTSPGPPYASAECSRKIRDARAGSLGAGRRGRRRCRDGSCGRRRKRGDGQHECEDPDTRGWHRQRRRYGWAAFVLGPGELIAGFQGLRSQWRQPSRWLGPWDVAGELGHLPLIPSE